MILKNRLIFILLFLLHLSIHTFAQVENKNLSSKLKDKLQEEIFSRIPIDSNNRIFILGEDHTFYTENSLLTIAAFETLLNRVDTINLVLEVPFAEAYLMNAYIQNNDKTILSYIEIFHESFRYELRELKTIYDWSGKKFDVIGIDLSGKDFITASLFLTKKIYEDNGFNKALPLSKDFKSLEKLSRTWWKRSHKRKMKKICEKIYNNIKEENQYSYEKDFFGENWNIIERIVEDYALGVMHRDQKILIEREKILYQRFSKLLNENPNDKYYAQFGLAHVNKGENICECYVIDESFVSELVKDSISLLSIAVVYNYESPFYLFRDFDWEGQEYMLEYSTFGKSEILKMIEEYSFKNQNYLIKTEGTISSQNYDYIIILNTDLNYFDD